MKDKIVFITPTKSRPSLYKRLEDSFFNNKSENGLSIILPVIDSDERQLYQDAEGELVQTPSNYELQDKLNYGARNCVNEYKYIGTFSDDIVVHTKDFDLTIIEHFEAHPEIKIIYCNDLLVGKALATHWVVRAEVVKALGFFALPSLRHMFLDNFWTKIGTDTNTIHYFQDIIWEHRHFTNHKSDNDATYQLSNNDIVFKADEKAYNDYTSSPQYEIDKQLLLTC